MINYRRIAETIADEIMPVEEEAAYRRRQLLAALDMLTAEQLLAYRKAFLRPILEQMLLDDSHR